MTYQWTLSPPAGSSASLSPSDQPTPSFVPDAEGIYTATLTVTANGASDSKAVAISVYHPVVVVSAIMARS